VIASTAATIIEKFFVYASGPEQSPFLRFERQHRQKRDRNQQQREEAGPTDLLDRVDDDSVIVFAPARAIPHLELLVGH
jgi:hypothetical protein